MTRAFTCHCSNTGVERTLNKSQQRKLTLEKKISSPPLPRFELATFRSQVWHSTNYAIQAPLQGLLQLWHCSSVSCDTAVLSTVTAALSTLSLQLCQLRHCSSVNCYCSSVYAVTAALSAATLQFCQLCYYSSINCITTARYYSSFFCQLYHCSSVNCPIAALSTLPLQLCQL